MRTMRKRSAPARPFTVFSAFSSGNSLPLTNLYAGSIVNGMQVPGCCMKGRFQAFCLIFAAVFSLAARAEASLSAGQPSAPPQPDAAQPLPDTFRGISLGMDLETVKRTLAEDGIFGYRGERDISLIPGGTRLLIETSGPSFLVHAWFQFHDGKLYNMSFALDDGRLDYFTLFSSLCEKYGEPQSVDPAAAVWESDAVRLSLERPLTVKYLDAVVFRSLLSAEYDNQVQEDLLRDDFVSEF